MYVARNLVLGDDKCIQGDRNMSFESSQELCSMQVYIC